MKNKETLLLSNELCINNKIFIFNLDNYISFIKNNTNIIEYELPYIISLTLNNKYSKILYSNIDYNKHTKYYNYFFIKMFMYNYYNNIKYLNKIMKIDKKKFNSFIKHISNKKRIYAYFEQINNNNIFFYLPIIIDLEKTIP